MRRRTFHRWRSIAVSLAILSTLLRGLIPVGFMPATAADARNGVVLMLCSGGALKSADARIQSPGGESQHAAGDECPFAFAAAPVLPNLLAIAPVYGRFLEDFLVPSPVAPILADTGRRPPPRGPPQFS